MRLAQFIFTLALTTAGISPGMAVSLSGSPVKVNTLAGTASNTSIFSQMTALTNGGFSVLWEEGNASARRVKVRTFNSTPAPTSVIRRVPALPDTTTQLPRGVIRRPLGEVMALYDDRAAPGQLTTLHGVDVKAGMTALDVKALVPPGEGTIRVLKLGNSANLIVTAASLSTFNGRFISSKTGLVGSTAFDLSPPPAGVNETVGSGGLIGKGPSRFVMTFLRSNAVTQEAVLEGSTFTNSAAPLQTAVPLLTISALDPVQPINLLGLSNGNFVLLTRRSGGDRGLYARLFSPELVPITPAQKLMALASNQRECADNLQSNAIPLADGGFMLCRQTSNTGARDERHYFRFNKLLAKVGSTARISREFGTHAGMIQLSNGKVAVSFSNKNNSPIYVQLLNP